MKHSTASQQSCSRKPACRLFFLLELVLFKNIQSLYQVSCHSIHIICIIIIIYLFDQKHLSVDVSLRVIITTTITTSNKNNNDDNDVNRDVA